MVSKFPWESDTWNIPLFISPLSLHSHRSHKLLTFKVFSILHVHLSLHLWFSFTFTFTQPPPFLIFPSPFWTLILHSIFLISVYVIVLFCLSSCPSIDCISLSLFCIHVLRHRQKPAMLECMCSRFGSDCATAEMNFLSNCILLWSDDTQMLIKTIIFSSSLQSLVTQS